MLAKATFGCMVVAMSLAGLAIGTAQLSEAQGTQSASVELLTWIFVIASFTAIAATIGLFVALLIVWTYRYLHAVRVMPGQWCARYWPLERIAQVSGIQIKHEEWAGNIRLICQAEFGSGKATFTRTERGFISGTYGVEFPQQPVDFLDDPKEGDTANITVEAIPSWWRGRPSHLIQQASIGITDHRPTESREQPQSSPDTAGSPNE